MREDKRHKHPYATYAILITLLGVIFWLSAQQGGSSHKMSQQICEKIVVHINNNGKLELTDSQFKRFVKYLDTPVRKIAHVVEYMVLGIIFYVIVSYYTRKTWKRVISVLLLLLMAGGVDEMHQMYIVARDGKWQDVMLDVAGGCVGIMMALGWLNRDE